MRTTNSYNPTNYLIYLPHFAFPLVASCIVIPREQEVRMVIKNMKKKMDEVCFFIVRGFKF